MAQTTETSRSTGPALAEVTGVAESAVADGRLVGVTVRVLHRGELVHRSAHGWADREARRPFVPEQRVRLASVTKPIVTAAVLRLVEEGTLSLDEPVRPLLPAFAPAGGEGITLRHLLTHTAGLSYPFNEPADGPYHRAGVSSGFDGLSIPMAEELARISAAGL
ncbi:MAG TPA: serine hydrolase domain-containing protein, partial [Ornithinicoccus sp.]|nr:serine hydrolase domain-containing protein [Ornithinicoccus sp.]